MHRGMLDYMKRAYGCVDCGTKTGRLDYDHVRGEKLFEIGENLDQTWDRILAEIAKCEVRCPSCHAERHRLERGESPPQTGTQVARDSGIDPLRRP
jgi:hypothetical protein